MAVSIIKWVIVLLATMNFGYMAFDGTRALIKGDYIRPRSGEYAGQLGPWSKVVGKVGIDPDSTTMKVLFVAWGLAGLFITACYALKMNWAANGLVLINIFSLWYLIPGTISSALQLALLLIKRFIG